MTRIATCMLSLPDSLGRYRTCDRLVTGTGIYCELHEKGNVNVTQMEETAVKEARITLYDALCRIGRAEAFNTATAAEIDSVIVAIWNGCRQSMERQSLDDEIPF